MTRTADQRRSLVPDHRWRSTISVAMSNYIEAGSIIAIAASLGFWQSAFHLGDGIVGVLAAFSPNAFGAAIGAIIGGPLCDRYGRKFIYTYDLLLYMLGMLFVIFAVNVALLQTGFLLAGIAVGAGVPAAWTYIAEQAPDGRRAAHVGTAQLAWSLGPMIGFLLAVIVAPLGLLGSRLIFAELFVVAGVTWWVRRGLPESRIWNDQKENDARSVSLSQSLKVLFSRKANWTAMLFLFGIYAFWNTVAGQAGIFMPRVYAASGFTSVTEQDLIQVLVWFCTSLFTYLGFMKFGDRMSRRVLFAVGAGMAIVAWVVLAFAPPSTAVLLFFAIVWGISAGIGAQAFYGLWTSELFATPYRAGAQGVLFTAARLMVGFLSLWFPTLLVTLGLHWLGALIIGLLAVSFLVGTIWAPETRGKSLRQIEQERYGEYLETETAFLRITQETER
ncbi:MAG: MFS transporter [Actinomycetia bacterium]|nr:MFS transporter [Actinomycetes bacterium]